MYVNEDASHAVVFVWGLVCGNWSDFPAPIPLQGLDAGKSYAVKELNVVKNNRHARVDGKTLGGDALMAAGLSVKLRGDYDSAVFELTAK